TFAPLSRRYLMVGSDSLRRLSLSTTPSLRGTLKSTRTITRLPAGARSSMKSFLPVLMKRSSSRDRPAARDDLRLLAGKLGLHFADRDPHPTNMPAIGRRLHVLAVGGQRLVEVARLALGVPDQHERIGVLAPHLHRPLGPLAGPGHLAPRPV